MNFIFSGRQLIIVLYYVTSAGGSRTKTPRCGEGIETASTSLVEMRKYMRRSLS